MTIVYLPKIISGIIQPELVQTSVVASGLSDHSAQTATLVTHKNNPKITKKGNLPQKHKPF